MLKTTGAMIKKEVFNPNGSFRVERPYQTQEGQYWLETDYLSPSDFAVSDEMRDLLSSKWQKKVQNEQADKEITSESVRGK